LADYWYPFVLCCATGCALDSRTPTGLALLCAVVEHSLAGSGVVGFVQKREVV